MKIGLTGATGFLGRFILQHLSGSGHACRCWYRAQSDRGGIEDLGEWIPGELNDEEANRALVEGMDAVVHAGLFHHGWGFRGAEGDLVEFLQKNLIGTIQLIEAARAAGVKRFVFISTCAVHEKILDDRPLDETHPLWPRSHYGAHKAAIEKLVHSYALGHGYDICALRPTGIYGIAQPVERSKWFGLVRDVVQSKTVECRRGGKEVHAHDVARAVGLLLEAPDVAGEAYACYDRYVSEFDVATLAKEISGSNAEIRGEQTRPKHQIDTTKIRELGFEFGGDERLRETIESLVGHVR